MEIKALRQKLHLLIDTSSTDRLLEIYNLLEKDYTDEFKAQLEEEYTDYKKNGEVISKEAIDEVIEQMLRGKNKA